MSVEAQSGFKRAKGALVAGGFKTSLAASFDTDCVAHSYGRVHDFLEEHPCKWLARAYLQIGDSEVLVAISWVEMPDSSLAGRYKQLIDAGAGNITELSRDTTLYKKIQYTNSTYTSGIKGNDVWNIQVKPIFPTPVDKVNKILEDSRQ